MAEYRNEYTKEDDFMLWQLHEIRHILAQQHRSPDQINRHAQEVLAQYNLTNLTIIRNVKHRITGRAGHSQERRPPTNERRQTHHVHA